MATEHEYKLALVVGGTSGLGLELANLLHAETNFMAYVTGRKEPDNQQLKFTHLDIGSCTNQLYNRIEKIVSELPQQIALLVYSVGFYQKGTIKQLATADIEKMLNAGLVAPTLILKSVLDRQGSLPGFIAITSTSQWIPRIHEPIYTAVKAGLGMLANSMSLDPQVGKVLVVGPAGMKTNFWANTGEDTGNMLEPTWVARQISHLYFEDDFKYKCARLLRKPPRVKVLERRL